MPTVSCPACGEDEELEGRRITDDGGDRVVVRCLACGTSWDRDSVPRCGLCGSDDIEGIPTATLREHGRGEQWAPSGIRLVHYCWNCLGDDVLSSSPMPGRRPAPGRSQDLRALRRDRG